MALQNEACEAADVTILCANNCGFFGSRATMNLCSKCYRNTVPAAAPAAAPPPSRQLREEGGRGQQGGRRTVESIEITGSSTKEEIIIGSSRPSSSSTASALQVNRQQRQSRCLSCRKRVGLTGFKCRCGDVFCALHRYSEKHDCSFDFKAAGRDAIAKANPLVIASKVNKI